jgi:hypothetical protein
MPGDAVYVGRPTRWGTPFPVAEHGRAEAVEMFRQWLTDQPDLMAAARRELARPNARLLVPVDQPCHADVLAVIANEDAPTPSALLNFKVVPGLAGHRGGSKSGGGYCPRWLASYQCQGGGAAVAVVGS